MNFETPKHIPAEENKNLSIEVPQKKRKSLGGSLATAVILGTAGLSQEAQALPASDESYPTKESFAFVQDGETVKVGKESLQGLKEILKTAIQMDNREGALSMSVRDYDNFLSQLSNFQTHLLDGPGGIQLTDENIKEVKDCLTMTELFKTHVNESGFSSAQTQLEKINTALEQATLSSEEGYAASLVSDKERLTDEVDHVHGLLAKVKAIEAELKQFLKLKEMIN